MEEKSIKVYNLLIMDESGSMSSVYDQALSSINETIMSIRAAAKRNPMQDHYVSIVSFEGSGMSGVKTRRDLVPVSELEDITSGEYSPGGCTPLYDAMGSSLNRLATVVGKDDYVLVTVVTDGYENSSKVYSGADIKEMVGKFRQQGWIITYIGANQDAVEVAKDLNINNALEFHASATGFKAMGGMAARMREATFDFMVEPKAECNSIKRYAQLDNNIFDDLEKDTKGKGKR